jgi:iron complex outermembrane receptor protein
MKLFRLLFPALFFLSSFAFGQVTLTGRLVDAQTRQPVTEAYFSTQVRQPAGLAQPLRERRQLETDPAGNFSLSLQPDEYQVIIGRLGYVPRTLDVSDPAFRNGLVIYLEPSLTELNEVVVSGYETGRRLLETPASVGLITPKDLQRFGNASLVPAFNTLPGVRMEERSPGSYRLSIRGSQLRSPFGVRNVKVYWNDIPFTDAGGNTPLNLVDFNHVNRVEVIKGPAGSIYGAGTGGAVLLYSPVAPANEQSGGVNVLAGSYGLLALNGAYQLGTEKSNLYLSYAHQQSDGYRANSAMRRDAVHLRGQLFTSEKRVLSVHALYSDLYYQTPGGLTQEQFSADPRQARPATRALPGAEAQRAAIYSKYVTLGVAQQYTLGPRLENVTSVYGSYNDFANPFITNYEERDEQGFGGRTRFTYQATLFGQPLRLVGGGEYQWGNSLVVNYGNQGGQRDTLQTDDRIRPRQYFAFGQAELELPLGFTVTAGGSYNQLRFRFVRQSDAPAEDQTRRYSPVVSPRFALLKKLGEDLAARASVSYGFSPPSQGELRPSEGTFNPGLAPERGINYEAGLRGSALSDRLTFDVVAFSLQLRETIVRRTIENGAEYFVNAGHTAQNGLEAAFSYLLVGTEAGGDPGRFLQRLRGWGSFTYNDFRFRNYRQDENDYSGNRVTGVAPTVTVAGVDAETRPGFYANLTFTFTDFIPLNDANTAYANDYALLGARLGYRRSLNRHSFEVFAGIDNALDEVYSLGNDINAFGGRYYNAAAPRNYYAGLRLKLGGSVRKY